MKKTSQIWLYRAAWCLAIAVGGCGGKAIVPSSYSTFTDELNVFTQYPDGWSADGGGQKDYSWAKFSSGNAQIEVDSDLATRVLLSQIAVTGQFPRPGWGLLIPGRPRTKPTGWKQNNSPMKGPSRRKNRCGCK